MELGRGYNKARNWEKMKHLHGGRADFNSDTVLVIEIPDTQVIHTLSRFLYLAMVLLMLLFLGFILKGFSSSSHSAVFSGLGDSAFGSTNAEILNLVLRDLEEEGLLKKEGKALIMSPLKGFEGIAHLNNEVDAVMDSNLETKNSLPNESYDIVFMPSFEDATFADRILKVNGIVAFPLTINPSNASFRKLSNYKVVYFQRHGSIIIAMRKLGLDNKMVDSSPKRKLFQLANEAKTTALKGLEDVLLEPPGKDLAKSKENLRIRYLPDLLGDSLEGYKRRVFLGVGLPEENRAAIEWFQRNYPKKSAKFEIHSLVVAPEDPVVPHTDVSAWLSKHVKEEEYVVMKAEADVVEDMIKKKTTYLVDELFLECHNDWWQTGKRKKSGRAYWECLALYGRLRDEGVAVHQWWG